MTWSCSYCGHPNLMNKTHCTRCGRPRGNGHHHHIRLFLKVR